MNRSRSLLSALAAVAILGTGGVIAMRGPAAPAAVSGEISAASLYDSVRAFVEAGPSAPGMASRHRVRDLITERLRASGARVQVMPFTAATPAGTWELENVFASFHPEAKDRVLLGAHWDTRLWAERDPDPTRRDRPITGANDGGSGVAVLLEIADALGRRPPPEGLGVDLAFFDGEEGFEGHDEAWFYGSKELADRWYRTGVALPRAVVVVDMVARQGLRIRREGFSQADPGGRRILDQLFAIAAERGYRSFVDAPGKHVLDDHIPFLARGIPAVDLIDLDDPHWHTHEDTLDKIDPRGMAEVADVVLTWVRRGAPSR